MSQIINSLRNILTRMSNKRGKNIKHRGIHQIQLSHSRRFNAYKVAGYSFGALVIITMGPIILWPIADIWLLPNVLNSTLSKTPSNQYKEQYNDKIWGRDYEISQIEYMMESLPNNIWILNGSTNSGKTAFIKKLLCSNKGIIYVDLRHFFDGNAFVFEMIDSLYNSNHNSSVLNNLVGCYVKLFCFVTTIIAQSDQHITAMLYFHAILNHLKAGITKYNKYNNNRYPLIIFDHFEALPSALKNCKETKNREMLSFIIYSISQFSSSICHDLSLSHVLFVGNDFFTLSKHENYNNQNMEKYIDENKDIKGCLDYLSSSILKHCEYWNIDGINIDIAIDHIINAFENKLNVSNNNEELTKIAKKLINCIGTKPHNISVALNAVTSNINENINGINELNKNITNYIQHFNKSQGAMFNIIRDDNNTKKLERFISSLEKTENNLMEWNEARKCFDNDQDLMISLMDNNVLSRKHGKKLSSDLNELIEMKLLGKDDSIYVGTMAECCHSINNLTAYS